MGDSLGPIATLGLSAGLGFAGSFFGPLGTQIGIIAGQALGGLLFGEGEPDVVNEGPQLNDLRVSTASYGRAIPWTFSNIRLGTSMFWGQELVETRHENTQEVGGKGGGGHNVTDISYTYALNAAFLVCRGERKIVKLMSDSKLMVDQGATGPTVQSKYVDQLRLYTGTETQLPDPLLVEQDGADVTPAYRGITYFVCDNFQLEDWGNRVPQFNAIVAQDATITRPVIDVDLEFDNTANGGCGGTDGGDVETVNSGIRSGRFWYDGSGRKWDMPTQSLYYTCGVVPMLMDSRDDVGYRYDIGSVHSLSRIDLATGLELNAIDDADDVGLAGYVFEDIAISRAQSPDPAFGPLNRIIVVDDDTDALTTIKVFGETVSDANKTLFDAGSISAKAAAELTVVLSGTDKNTGLGLDAHPSLPTDFSTNGPPGIITDSNGECWIIAEMVGTGDVGTPNVGLWNFDPWSLSFGIFREYSGGLSSTGRGKIGYDSSTNSLIWVGTDGNIRHYDIDGDTFTDTDVAGWDADNNANIKSGSSPSGFFWMRDGDSINKFSMTNLVFEGSESITVDLWLDTGSSVEGFMFDPHSNSAVVISDGGSPRVLRWLMLERSTTSLLGVSLESIIQDICADVDFDLTDLDTTDISDIFVKGFAITHRMSCRSAIEALRLFKEFDAAEIDYKLVFQRKVASSLTRTLTQTEVGFGAKDALVTDTRKGAYDLPQRLEVTYQDIDTDFQAAIQQSKRGDIVETTRDQLKIAVQAVLDSQEAKDLSESLLYRLWIEIDTKDLKVSQKNIDLAPMDTIEVVFDDGATFRMYLENVSFGEDVTQELKGPIQDPELANGSNVVAEAPNFTEQVLSNPGAPVFELIDTSLLRDDDGDGLYIYSAVGVAGDQAGFNGAAIRRSFDGFSWTDFHTTLRDEVATTGLMISRGGLNNVTRYDTWDRTSTVRVRMFSGTLTSVTEDQVLDGANAMLIGNEIIQFANATLISAGVYDLTDLLRGRRGTDTIAHMTHSSSERVVLLSVLGVGLTSMDSGNLQRLTYFQAIDLAQSQISTTTLVPLGKTRYPYSPVHIFGTASGSDVAVTWKRRTRVGHFADYLLGPSTAPLSEDSEEYEIDILAQGGSTVLNTIQSLSSESYTITQADLDVAFGTSFDPAVDAFDVILYQLSAIVGRGYPSRQVTLPNVGVPVTHPGAT